MGIVGFVPWLLRDHSLWRWMDHPKSLNLVIQYRFLFALKVWSFIWIPSELVRLNEGTRGSFCRRIKLIFLKIAWETLKSKCTFYINYYIWWVFICKIQWIDEGNNLIYCGNSKIYPPPLLASWRKERLTMIKYFFHFKRNQSDTKYIWI